MIKYPDAGQECLQRNRLKKSGATRSSRYFRQKRTKEIKRKKLTEFPLYGREKQHMASIRQECRESWLKDGVNNQNRHLWRSKILAKNPWLQTLWQI